MTGKIEIKLEGKPYEIITPFTLGDLTEIQVACARPASSDPAEESKRSVKLAVDVIVAALHCEHPQMTEEVVLNLRLLPGELGAAVTSIVDVLKPGSPTAHLAI